jgi:hypothetical protein
MPVDGRPLPRTAIEGNTASIMFRITYRVVARFPHQELAIERLARRSESFRAMCQEYNDGVEAIDRWQDVARPRVELDELKGLLADLEAEILAALEEDATAGSGRHGRAGRL